MKNKREIILDFTSLLDIIMIILFFFILFSHFDTVEQKKELEDKYNAAIAEAEEVRAEAESLFEEAEAKNSEAEKIISEAESSGLRDAYNVDGIMEFGRGMNLKINLNMNGSEWSVDFLGNDDVTDSIENSSAEVMAERFIEVLDDKGYTPDDTILCVFIYDASEKGTYSAYRSMSKVFNIVGRTYGHFFFSETDISTLKG